MHINTLLQLRSSSHQRCFFLLDLLNDTLIQQLHKILFHNSISFKITDIGIVSAP